MFDTERKHVLPAGKYAACPMETMGDRIRLLREARGLTQQQLADRCSVTKAAVSAWERGEAANIKLKTFLVLRDVLMTDFEYLVYGPDRAPESSPPPGGHKLRRVK
jgi:transcriptional regulator with XRE-family HTH domain